MESAVPYLSRREVYRTVLIGALVVAVLGLVCIHVAVNGGPAWLAGQELAIFLKFSLLTVAVVGLDLCWNAKAR
jgi:hypothetical protein